MMMDKKDMPLTTESQRAFVKGEHFYYNEQGLMVLTEQYLMQRGYCCNNNCLHCPYRNKDMQKRY